jgi:hypothetical protein
MDAITTSIVDTLLEIHPNARSENTMPVDVDGLDR